MSAGLRLESVERKPETGQDRKFDLTSYSVGGQWRFMNGYAFGATGSVADWLQAATAKTGENTQLRRYARIVAGEGNALALYAQGVAPGRITAIGMGEAKPLADNATEEGRAQNRRVTIRRTDCGPAN